MMNGVEDNGIGAVTGVEETGTVAFNGANGGSSAEGAAKGGRPSLRIRAGRAFGWGELEDLWDYRDLLWSLAFRDLKLRYRQTALGVLWVVFQPVAGAGIFAMVFGWIAGISGGGQRYFLYSLAGLLVWNTFQSTFLKVSMAVLANGALVSKVYFPRLLLPLATVLSTLVDLAIGLVVFFVLAAADGWKPGLSLLKLPLWIGLSVGLAFGGGLGAASLMARFRDVQHVLPMLLPFLMYATPVAYSVDGVPAALRWAFVYNPMAWVVEGGRSAFFGQGGVDWVWTGYATAVAVAGLGVGWWGFRKMERSLADVL
jgi:lipopolysaccharide transport system permease protein